MSNVLKTFEVCTMSNANANFVTPINKPKCVMNFFRNVGRYSSLFLRSIHITHLISYELNWTRFADQFSSVHLRLNERYDEMGRDELSGLCAVQFCLVHIRWSEMNDVKAPLSLEPVVCQAWPVWCLTYGHLLSHKLLPPCDRYQIILLGDRDTCLRLLGRRWSLFL